MQASPSVTFGSRPGDAHLKLATISWCMIFGSDDEERADLHWKKTPVDQADIDDFRRRILAGTSFTQEIWNAYHKNMLDFRNKFVAHVDIRRPFAGVVPDFDAAIQVAYAYVTWVRGLIGRTGPMTWESDPLQWVYTQSEEAARSVVNKRP